MAKIKYIDKKFRENSLLMIAYINEVIDEYQEKGYDLTLRQVYYQLVAKDYIPNSERSYKNLGAIVNDGRLAGMIDWDAIIDRTRNLKGLGSDESPEEAISQASRTYRRDKWENQPYQIEVWVEKDALAGVVGQICSKHDVNYFSCRGYTSQSEMWRAARRLQYYEQIGKQVVLLHLGDHDPSGMDMSRDIVERLELFGITPIFKRLALNMRQIKAYNPPPNPAKLSDSRSEGYINKFGYSSWELDALTPEQLDQLISSNIKKYIDQDLLKETEYREMRERRTMREIVRKWDEIEQLATD